jgi:DHA1 family multidrug resistance protein-like MFS transporter
MPLYVLAAVIAVGNGSVFALLADLQDEHGLPTWGLGLISSSAFFAALVVQLSLSRYADRGRGALLLRLGVVAVCGGLLWMGAATDLWQFVGARALLGTGTGLFIPAARRAVIVADPARQAEKLGMLFAAFLAGFVLGPPIAAVIATAADLRAPFLLFGALVAACGVLIFRMPVPAAGPHHGERGVLRLLVRRREVVAAVLVVVSLRFSIGVFEPVWARFFTDLGASTLVIGLSLTAFAAPMVVVARFGGRLADRHGARWVSLLTAAITVPFMASYGFTTSILLLTLLALLHGVFEAVETPGSQAAVADAAPLEHAAAAQGLAEAAGSAAAAVGALGAAPLYDWLGAGAAWPIFAAVMVVCLAGSVLLHRPVRRRVPALAT